MDDRGWTFFTGWSIIDYGLFFRSDNLKVKYFNGGFVSYKHAAFLFTRR